MNLHEVMSIAVELQSFIVLMQSPDARWDSLQLWIAKHPRWRSKLNHYVEVTPDEALTDLKEFICETTGASPMLLAAVVTPAKETEARGAIEKLQTLYRERASLDQPKGQRKNVRRAN